MELRYNLLVLNQHDRISDDYISAFVDAFRQEREQYIAVEHEVESICKKFLKEKRVKFCWESRVKQPASLQSKLQSRNQGYSDQRENCAEIWDLVAGRIVLPRWSNFKIVEEMITEHFGLHSTTHHPRAPWRDAITLWQRFRGYDGFHFYIKRKNPVTHVRIHMIEIQVMSPFMWTYQELQHDVEYKEIDGNPSKEETRAPEYLKGIVNLGEIAIQHFEAALFTRHHSSPTSGEGISERKTLDDLPAGVGPETQDEMRALKIMAVEKFERMDSLIRIRKEQCQEQDKIAAWLSSTNVDVEHNRIRDKLGKHYHNSGQWFKLNHYSSWVSSTTQPTMWIVGSVGTGKSSLM